MAVTTDNRKRRVDASGSLEPNEVWNGKTWYDYNSNRLKIYSSMSGAWLSEDLFTWTINNTPTILLPNVSGGVIGGAPIP